MSQKSECRASKDGRGVTEMCMLRYMCGNALRNKLKNEDIRRKVRVETIEGNIREKQLRCFGRVK